MSTNHSLAAFERASNANDDLQSLLDDVSRQMAFSKLNRRSSNRQQERKPNRATDTKRIIKVASAGNSPRKNERRRYLHSTLGNYRHSTVEGSRYPANSAYARPTSLYQQSRPTTWHPSYVNADLERSAPMAVDNSLSQVASHEYPNVTGSAAPLYDQLSSPLYPQEQFSSSSSYQPALITSGTNYDFTPLEYPQTQSAYPFPQSGLPQWPALCNDGVMPSYLPFDTQLPLELIPNQFMATRAPIDLYGFNTAPQTPEDFFSLSKPGFVVEQDAFSTSMSQEPPEKELIGMGLYDDQPQSKMGTSGYDQYHSLMMSQLLGAETHATPMSGKGLKLEETWEPPEIVDDQADSESSDQDDQQDAEEVDDEQQHEMEPAEAEIKIVEVMPSHLGGTETGQTDTIPTYGNEWAMYIPQQPAEGNWI